MASELAKKLAEKLSEETKVRHGEDTFPCWPGMVHIANTIDEAIAETKEQCAEEVESLRSTSPSPIGPMFGAGWDEAVKRIPRRLRTLVVK